MLDHDDLNIVGDLLDLLDGLAPVIVGIPWTVLADSWRRPAVRPTTRVEARRAGRGDRVHPIRHPPDV